MKNRIVALALLPLCLLGMERQTPSIPTDVISLGRDCEVAYQMHINGLRKAALPFDWLLTSSNTLELMLLQRLEGFTDPTNFELVVQGDPTVNGGKYILDRKYQSQLIHDFKLDQDYMKDFPIIQEKYQRRITRLREIIDTTAHPLFIRKAGTQTEALALHAALNRVRNDKPFTLAILDTTPEIKEDWRLQNKGICNFYLQPPVPYDWTGNHEAWKEILIKLGLTLSTKENSTKEQ